jgi:hypothetical protein
MLNRKNNIIMKSLIMSVLAVLMIFSVSIRASAQTTDAGIVQTNAGENSATIKWNTDKEAYGYNIYISSDGETFSRITNEKICDVSNNTKKKISGLKTGRTYYVKVASVYKSETDVVTEGKKSSGVKIVTSPSRVDASSIKQIKATSKTVTIKWSSSKGATGYILYLNDKKIKTVTSTNAVLKAEAGSVNSIKIIPVRTCSTGYTAKGGHSESYNIYAAPAKPVKVAVFKENNFTWYPTQSNKVVVGWNNNSNNKYSPTGYQVEIYSVKGKKLKTYYRTKTQVTITQNIAEAVKNKGFKIRVRAYIKINGKIRYGEWSTIKTIIPEAKISLTRTDKEQLTVKWKKVSDVQKYYVYVCTDIKAKNPKWKKVATVGKNKTSYVINNCKVGKYNAVYVIPVVKAGKKTYKAKYTWYMYMEFK